MNYSSYLGDKKLGKIAPEILYIFLIHTQHFLAELSAAGFLSLVQGEI